LGSLIRRGWRLAGTLRFRFCPCFLWWLFETKELTNFRYEEAGNNCNSCNGESPGGDSLSSRPRLFPHIENCTRSFGCTRDDRSVWGRTNEDARAYIDWRGLVQRSFVGSRVCATPLPQDDSGRLACPWAFSRVGSSILGSDWPCPVSEVDGVRWSRFSFPSFPHRTRKDGAPASWRGEIERHRVPRLRSG
jgi:hypothetical protein